MSTQKVEELKRQLQVNYDLAKGEHLLHQTELLTLELNLKQKKSEMKKAKEAVEFWKDLADRHGVLIEL